MLFSGSLKKIKVFTVSLNNRSLSGGIKSWKQTNKEEKENKTQGFSSLHVFFPEGVEPADHGTHSRTYGSQSLGARVSSLRKAPLQWLLSDYQGTLWGFSLPSNNSTNIIICENKFLLVLDVMFLFLSSSKKIWQLKLILRGIDLLSLVNRRWFLGTLFLGWL